MTTKEKLEIEFECGCKYTLYRGGDSCGFLPCQNHDKLIHAFHTAGETS